MSQKRPRSPTPPLPTPSPPDIHESSPITDRSSTFTAVYSPTLPLSTLQSLPQFASATHRIAAWRSPSNQRTVSGTRTITSGYDDDGERYGGKTLLKVLEEEKVQGVVVVVRWFGGVMLGPVRFDHLRNCARESIVVWRTGWERRERLGMDEGGKRVKLMEAEWEVEAERDRLIRELPERDESVRVLRGLLAEKKARVTGKAEGPRGDDDIKEDTGDGEGNTEGDKGEKAGEKSNGVSEDAQPVTLGRMTPAYEKMPLEALRKLEKVRDATIGWILKQIEEVEQNGRKGGEKVKEAG